MLALALGAIPGKVLSGFPSGIARKQRDRAAQRFLERLSRSGAVCRKRPIISRGSFKPIAARGSSDWPYSCAERCRACAETWW
ncbi:hypothetical protein CCGE531_19885 (plasmid) [Rhizobium sp. CCGE531]|nr:hypothetical protein CCGE531_19885 [Rhizobium sp. CCGE531]AYG74794.1 hypothetical protein CCGE532_19370 [Rhizobium sp. CCGE532]